MTDERLLEAKRAWQQVRTVETEAQYLLARARAGELRSERLALAAAFGHPAAQQTGIPPLVLPNPVDSARAHGERVSRALALLDERERVEFACECADAVLYLWEEYAPQDVRPRRALEATRAWLAGRLSREEVLAAAERASPCQHPMHAGDSTTQAARAATDAAGALSNDPAIALYDATCAATRAVRAAASAAEKLVFAKEGLGPTSEATYQATTRRVEQLQLEMLGHFLAHGCPPRRTDATNDAIRMDNGDERR